MLFAYEALPFMTSQDPYFEVLRAADTSHEEGTAGGSVEVAIYGWGLQPVYTSGRSAWPITDELFARIYASREPFWAEVEAGGPAIGSTSRTTASGSSRSATRSSACSITPSTSPS